MFNKDAKEKFHEDMAQFNYGAALRQFFSDNITLCMTILAVSAIAAASTGAKGLLTHRRVTTIILCVMVCRAFYAGATANRPRIQIKDITPQEESNDPEQNS